MSLFKCKHDIEMVDFIGGKHSETLGPYAGELGALLVAEGVCRKCHCQVKLQESIYSRFLYLHLRQENDQRRELRAQNEELKEALAEARKKKK